MRNLGYLSTLFTFLSAVIGFVIAPTVLAESGNTEPNIIFLNSEEEAHALWQENVTHVEMSSEGNFESIDGLSTKDKVSFAQYWALLTHTSSLIPRTSAEQLKAEKARLSRELTESYWRAYGGASVIHFLDSPAGYKALAAFRLSTQEYETLRGAANIRIAKLRNLLALDTKAQLRFPVEAKGRVSSPDIPLTQGELKSLLLSAMKQAYPQVSFDVTARETADARANATAQTIALDWPHTLRVGGIESTAVASTEAFLAESNRLISDELKEDTVEAASELLVQAQLAQAASIAGFRYSEARLDATLEYLNNPSSRGGSLAARLTTTLDLYDRFGATRAAFERINASAGLALPKHLAGGLKPLQISTQNSQVLPRYARPRNNTVSSVQPLSEQALFGIAPAGQPNSLKDSMHDQVLAAVETWRAAWSDQKVDTYLNSYARDFVGQGFKSHSAWEMQRKQRVSKPKKISIVLAEVSVNITSPTQAEVMFKQTYQSNSYRDQVQKHLVLVKNSNGWKIAQEQSH